MDVELFREYCLSKPCVTEGTPFGEDVLVFKVGEKMFALVSENKKPLQISLKCDPVLAETLRQKYDTVMPGYHLNKKHWNTIEIEAGVPDVEIRKMIDHSYDLVAKKLPKSRSCAVLRRR